MFGAQDGEGRDAQGVLGRELQPPRTASPSCNPNLSAKPALFKPFLLEMAKRSAINVQVLRWEVSVEVSLLGF